jgi:hypothetical protein
MGELATEFEILMKNTLCKYAVSNTVEDKAGGRRMERVPMIFGQVLQDGVEISCISAFLCRIVHVVYSEVSPVIAQVWRPPVCDGR